MKRLPLAPMIIAVDTRFLINGSASSGYFIRELLQALAKSHPEHQFYFLFDQSFDEFVFSSNVHPVVIKPKATHPLLWKYWYDVKLPLTLKKIKADVFISADGFCSLTTATPQCLVIHDPGFLHTPGDYKKSHVRFLEKNTPKFLRKAKTVVTISQLSKQNILRHYKIDAAKIDVVPAGVKPIFHPLSFDEKEVIMGKNTEGKEYFLCLGTILPQKDLVNLLKAFSMFKKRLQSSMKLVIAGTSTLKNKDFLQRIQTYKYRSDVILAEYLPDEDVPLLLGGAYAFVYPSFSESSGVHVAEAMKCEVPVLVPEASSTQEVAAEAGLYFDPNDHGDLAEKMMLIYKDENLRKQLIEKGKAIAGKYTWQKSAEIFWESVIKTAESR